MNCTMIEKWNGKVNEDDYVIHAGDFALTGKKKKKGFIDALNGKIILIKGNHDSGSYSKLKRLGFYEVYNKFLILNKYIIISHKPLDIKDIKQYERVAYKKDTNFKYQIKVNLHGHIHNKNYENDNKDISYKNICVEKLNYEPKTLKEIGLKNQKSYNFIGLSKMSL